MVSGIRGLGTSLSKKLSENVSARFARLRSSLVPREVVLGVDNICLASCYAVVYTSIKTFICEKIWPIEASATPMNYIFNPKNRGKYASNLKIFLGGQRPQIPLLLVREILISADAFNSAVLL